MKGVAVMKVGNYPHGRLIAAMMLGGSLVGAGLSLLLRGETWGLWLGVPGLVLVFGALAYEVIYSREERRVRVLDVLRLVFVAVLYAPNGYRAVGYLRAGDWTRSGISLASFVVGGAGLLAVRWWLTRDDCR